MIVALASCVPIGGGVPPLAYADLPEPGGPNRLTTTPSTFSNPAGSARLAGVRAGPAVAALPMSEASARDALAAFRLSCPALVRRDDASGLTRGVDWVRACQAARWADGDARRFFADYFETAVVGDGRAFATGYYEPEIAAAPTRRPGFEVPIYRRPADLVETDLGLSATGGGARRARGRVENGQLVLYHDRAAIEAGALAGRGLELAWAADPVEFFFLQVQGSGRLRMPDGSVMRIGYDGQNGRDYVGIGALMRDRGLLDPSQGSMQGIMAWLRAHPDQASSLMNENKSFVFFREIAGAGPPGALGVAVAPRVTVAADPAFVPLGAPVFLELGRAEANGLWVAQDTGGAIKGANRFDTFWGAGEAARTLAGGMATRGTALLLLPRGAVARLGATAGGGAGGGAAAGH